MCQSCFRCVAAHSLLEIEFDQWTFESQSKVGTNSLSNDIILLHQLPSPPRLCNSLTPHPTHGCSWQLRRLTLKFDSFEYVST